MLVSDIHIITTTVEEGLHQFYYMSPYSHNSSYKRQTQTLSALSLSAAKPPTIRCHRTTTSASLPSIPFTTLCSPIIISDTMSIDRDAILAIAHRSKSSMSDNSKRSSVEHRGRHFKDPIKTWDPGSLAWKMSSSLHGEKTTSSMLKIPDPKS